MPHIAGLVIALTALVFVGVSATMNALFLSSLGRTGIEAALLCSLSIAADATKLALPVVLLRGIAKRAWSEVAGAGLMLAAVVALSLASGLGFAAMTRAGTAARQTVHADQLAALMRDEHRLEQRLSLSSNARSKSVTEAEIALLKLDRLWAATKFCTEIRAAAQRTYCEGLLRLNAELAAAEDRSGIEQERARLSTRIEALRDQAVASDADPQAGAVAALLGIEPGRARVIVVSSLSVILELGSVLLVALAAGRMAWGDRRAVCDAPPFTAAQVPSHTDRSYWQRSRAMSAVAAPRKEGSGAQRT